MNVRAVVVLLLSSIVASSFESTATGNPKNGGQTNYLLSAISPSKAESVREANAYFIAKESYFASRVRIVRVNVRALLEGNEIAIPVFDDKILRVQPSSIEISTDGHVIQWTGQFVAPGISKEDLISAGMDVDSSDKYQSILNQLTVTAAEVSFDPISNWKHPYYFPRFQEFVDDTREVYSGDGVSAVYDVIFTIPAGIAQSTLELRPIPTDPGHHLLLELDPDLAYTKPIEPGAIILHADGRADGVDSEIGNDERKRRYEQFLIMLGPDPRTPLDHSQR